MRRSPSQDPRYSKDKHLRRSYGISLEEYESMRESQRGMCAGCAGRAETLVVDHCHATGKVRGLLCSNCNTALGMVRDEPETLEWLASYLEGRNLLLKAFELEKQSV